MKTWNSKTSGSERLITTSAAQEQDNIKNNLCVPVYWEQMTTYDVDLLKTLKLLLGLAI